MPETNQDDVQAGYDAVFDTLVGKKPAATPDTKSDDTPAEPAKAKEQESTEKPAEEKPEPKGQSDDELPALYRPDKYKNRAAEKEAFENQQKLLGKRDDDAKAWKSLQERLADPEQAAEAVRELAERNNIKLDSQKQNKPDEKAPKKVGDIDLEAIDDDEIVTGANLKAILAKLGETLAEGQQKLSTVAEPILKERRFKELEEKGDLFTLVRDPDISKIRDELHESVKQGKVKYDEVLHLAATATALRDGKLFESFENMFGEQYRASLTVKKQLPESGSHTTNDDKKPKEKSPEEQVHDIYGGALSIVDGR